MPKQHFARHIDGSVILLKNLRDRRSLPSANENICGYHIEHIIKYYVNCPL